MAGSADPGGEAVSSGKEGKPQHPVYGDTGVLPRDGKTVPVAADCPAELVVLQRDADVYQTFFQGVLWEWIQGRLFPGTEPQGHGEVSCLGSG